MGIPVQVTQPQCVFPDENGHPGQNVRRLREARGWTQEQLAEKIDRTPEAISQVETGARGGSQKMLREIALALGVPLAEIYRARDASIGETTPPEFARFIESPQGAGVTDEESAQLRAIAIPGRKMTEMSYTLALAMIRSTVPSDD